MSSIYLLLLLFYVVNAKFALMPDGSIREVADDYDSNATSQKTLTVSTSSDQNSSQKPHIIMTFIAKDFVRNNQSEQPATLQLNQKNQTQLQQIDPLQQFLQFFFSGVMRDFEPFEKRVHSYMPGENEKGIGAPKNNGRCEHGRVIFCTKCRLRFINKTTTESSTAPPTQETTNKNMALLPEENKRHYFLSISGGSDKRAAALIDAGEADQGYSRKVRHAPGENFQFIAKRLRNDQLLVDYDPDDNLTTPSTTTQRKYDSTNFTLSVISMPIAIVISVVVVALIFLMRSTTCSCKEKRGVIVPVTE